MANIWKPKPEDRLDWTHPAIQLTRIAPGYLLQELFGYSDSYWEKWLLTNKDLWTARNRRPWIYLDKLGSTNVDINPVDRR
jgi:hypothetical protein